MKNHIIELDGLQEWMVETETMYASSTSPKKQLTVTTNGTLKVYHNGKAVWQGVQPFMAVEKYNAIEQ